MLFNCRVGEDSWESLGLQADQTSQSKRKPILNIHGKDWRWSWSSNTSATWRKELTHWKRPWCLENLKAAGDDDRRWHGWMALLTRWTWDWASCECWWWTREAWHPAVHGVAKSWTGLSYWADWKLTILQKANDLKMLLLLWNWLGKLQRMLPTIHLKS